MISGGPALPSFGPDPIIKREHHRVNIEVGLITYRVSYYVWGAVCKATQYIILHHFLVKLRAISCIVAIYVYCCNMC